LIVACIPAYNEEDTIAKIILLTKKYVDKVIVCDDGSTDLTGEIAVGLSALLIKHTQRKGYGAAVRSLFNKAIKLGADLVVTLDGDGQHNPDELPMLIEPILQGNADMVIGSRFIDENANDVPRLRRIGIGAITRLTSIASGVKINDAQSGFRVYSKKAIKLLELTEDGMGASTEILLKAYGKDLRIVELPITVRYEGLDTSTYHPLMHGMSVVTSIIKVVVEEQPLTFLGIPGFICLLVGIFFGVWMLQGYAAEHRIITNIALASIGFILIGTFTIFSAITLYAISRLNKIRK
jgi:glycosyltransferase involved in cell wall biosynthesis